MTPESSLKMIKKYQSLYQATGYSPKSLGWDKGKQEIRFQTLFEFFSWEGKRILDIGCGFGDFSDFLIKKLGPNFSYIGIDMVPEFIDEAIIRNNFSEVSYLNGNFLEYNFSQQFDIIVGSGIFNHKFSCGENLRFIEDTLKRAFNYCRDGVAFDFLTDKVEFTHSHTFHTNPEWLLEIGYTLTNNIILRNDIMPFECSICLRKNQNFLKEDTVFIDWKERQ